MRLIFSPHPKLLPGDVRKTEVDVDASEKMGSILDRIRIWLSLWLSEVGGDKREWQVTLQNDTKIDPKFTPEELHLQEGQVLYVDLKEAIPPNPLDEISESLGSNECLPNVLEGEDLGGAFPSAEQMPTEADILHYEQAKEEAMKRAQEIEREKGMSVSHRKILHDEAVDDYDDDEGDGYDDQGYYGDMGYGHDARYDDVEGYWEGEDNSYYPEDEHGMMGNDDVHQSGRRPRVYQDRSWRGGGRVGGVPPPGSSSAPRANPISPYIKK